MFVPIGILVLSTIQYASTNFTFPSRQSDTSTNTSRDPGVNLSPNVNLGNEVSGEGRNLFNYDPGTSPGGPPREGKHLFNWLDDIVTPERDPYIKKLNDGCLEGNLYECFKWKALSNLESFFNYDQYGLNENTKVIKIFRETSAPQDSEFARSIPQTQEPEFDSFLQFLGRKMESFIKSRAIEVNLPEDVTEYGRYEPKALFDDIASEVDILEDKKDNLIKRHKLKKLIIPLLIVLKLFKLKLLLFLPLILGLAGFKKVLGLLAIAIPGLIGYFKFCRPQNYGTFGHSNFYSAPHGPTYVKEAEYHQGPAWNTPYQNDNAFAASNAGSYGPNGGSSPGGFGPNGGYGNSGGGGGISFKDSDAAQSLAYSSYVKK
ncbi:hypothetical protein M8J76_012275 [Diaphorina citri]|nr:hypothetical protein M8J76_012275 [Diaphorina citri]